MFSGNRTVLVVGAHPDDEVLGVGGTIAKHVDGGDEVHVLLVTEGVSSRTAREDAIDRREQSALDCRDVLGVRDVTFVGFADMRLDRVAHVEVNAAIEDAVDRLDPDVVYTHSATDVNADHRAVHESTLVATRPASSVEFLLAYETPSATEWGDEAFDPNVYVDVTGYVDRKVDGFLEYEDEVREFPHPRSERAIRTRAADRGVEAGVEAAEGFELLRGRW